MKIVFTDDGGIYAYAAGAHGAVGGAERQQWYLARALASTGWKVVVGIRRPLKAGQRCTVENVELLVAAAQSWQRRDSRDRAAFYGERIPPPGTNTTTGVANHNYAEWTVELRFIADFAEPWAERTMRT